MRCKMATRKIAHRPTFAFMLLNAAALAASAGCNPNPGESATLGDSATDTSTGTTGETATSVPTTGEPPGPPCANPDFDPGDGPGEMVQCVGEVVDSVFTYTKCAPLCNTPGVTPIEPVAFPADQEVGACCVDSATPEQRVEACVSDCAHAACLEAIDRFQALIDDIANQVPGNPAEDCPTQACRDRAIESLTFFRNFIGSNFTDCVTSIKLDVPFGMGDPPGCNLVGCIQDGVLDLNCSVTEVNTDVVIEPVCDDALHQPPDGTQEAGAILGGQIVISGLGDNEVTPMTGTYVRSARPLCFGPPCVLVLEQIDVVAADFQIGTLKVSNFKAELATQAQGELVGDSAVFPPGSIAVHVMADIQPGKGKVTSFEGYATNEETAFVDTTDSVFTLDNAVFSIGPLTFVASVDPSPCQPM